MARHFAPNIAEKNAKSLKTSLSTNANIGAILPGKSKRKWERIIEYPIQ